MIGDNILASDLYTTGGEWDILNNINPIFENVDSSDHKDIFESALVARKRLIILHFQN